MNILLIGCAGAGKTWVMKSLVLQRKCLKTLKIGKIYCHTDDFVVVLGKYDNTMYEGSDRLSMSVLTDLDRFKAWASDKIVLAEGDRFMNNTYISKMQPIIIKILDDGKLGRSKRGSRQTARQLKTITTRVGNIDAHYDVENSTEAYALIKRLIDEV